MASDTDTDYAANFTPQKYVDLRIGKTTVQVYPPLTPTMLKSKKSFGYLVSKNSIFQADAPIRDKLTAFGQCTDTTALIKIIDSKYGIIANKMIVNSTKLIVVSYHISNKKIIPNCMKSTK